MRENPKLEKLQKIQKKMPQSNLPLPLQDEAALAHVEILAEKLEYAGNIFQVRDELVRFAAGDQAWRQYTMHHRAVAIVPLRLNLAKELEILLIRQYRHPVRKIFWELPAGLCDIPDESPLATAKRELAEETGQEAAHWQSLVAYYPSPGCSDEQVELFVALNPRPIAPGGSIASGVQQTAVCADFLPAGEEAEIIVQWDRLADVCAAILRKELRSSVLSLGALAVWAEKEKWQARLAETSIK